MVTSNGLKAGIIAAALVAWPLVAGAQTTPGQQSTAGQQQTGTQTTTTQQGAQTQNPGQNPSAESARQEALTHLTAARQSLADLTKLPATARLEGQTRNQINELISNFNALITSTGPDWRAAYDKVQGDLTALIGPEPGQPGQGTVGTSGTSPSNLDPSISAKLNEVRQHVDEFGKVAGVQPGQSAQAQAASAGTTGTVNEQALRNVDQINAMVARFLSQPSMSPNQDSVTVSRQDLQQIQQYLTQLRQSLGQQNVGK